MQREPRFFNEQVNPTEAYGVGGNTCNTQFGGHYAYGAPAAPAFTSALAGTNRDFIPSPLNGLEFQTMDTCPQNYIIFDQTENKSRVMFHPALARKLNCPYDFNHIADNTKAGFNTPEKNDKNHNTVSSLKENTADIDALLSSDEDEEEDDVVSTGRSPANWAGISPNYSSSDEETSSYSAFSSDAGPSNSYGSTTKKKEKMRKMVKALRGIIPGGATMGTPAVLDEAVKYLKSLKVEVKKLGIQDLE